MHGLLTKLAGIHSVSIIGRTILTCVLLSASLTTLANDVARQFLPEQFQPVIVGETTAYVIRIDSQRPLSLGLARIFVSPAAGKLAFSPALTLANNLAEKGWHVDIVTPHWLTSTAEDSADTTLSSSPLAWQSHLVPELDFIQTQQQTKVLLPALDSLSQDVAGFRLVIAEGVIAALLLANGNEADATLPDAATFIAPFWPENSTNNSIPSLTGSYPAPLLDIGFASSSRFAIHHAQQRMTAAKVEVKLHYRQRMLPRIQTRTAMAWVGGEIVGWTRSLGW